MIYSSRIDVDIHISYYILTNFKITSKIISSVQRPTKINFIYSDQRFNIAENFMSVCSQK